MIVGLFGRAKKILNELSEPPKARVQYFNVSCPAGHWIRGERTLGYQALRCPGCGEGVFVLPLSPLPEPAAPVSGPSRAVATSASTAIADEGPVGLVDAPASTVVSTKPRRDDAEVEIEWDEPDPSQVSASDSSGTEGMSARKPRPAGTVKPSAATDRSNQEAVIDKSTSKPTGVRKTKRRGGLTEREPAAVRDEQIKKRPILPSRPILIFLGVTLLVVGTLGFRIQRNKRQGMPAIYESGRTEGIEALDGGQFDKAYQLLSAAKGAVQTLGSGLEGAPEVLQASEEAAIFIDLIPDTLEDLLAEAARQDPKSWDSRFAGTYSGRSIVVDAHIVGVPGNPGSSYELDYLVLPPGGASSFRDSGAATPERVGRIDLSGFQLFEQATPKLGDHVVFGAKLDSFRFDSKQDGWVVKLKPRSGVFITHAKALESLGWPSPEIPDNLPTRERR